MNRQMRNSLIKAAIVILFLAGAYSLWCHLLSNDVIWKNITVNGISLQGMKKQEAVDALRDDFEAKYKDSCMTVRLNGETYQVSVFPLLDLDAEQIVESAYALGHGPWYKRGTDRIHFMNSGQDRQEISLMPFAAYTKNLDSVLSDSGIEEGGTVVESSWHVTDTSLVITKGKSGNAPDMEELKKNILEHIASEEFEGSIDCPTVDASPEALDFDACYEEVYKEAADASLDEKTLEITPSVTGVSFDRKTAKKKYKAAKEGETVTIELTLTQPEITTEDIEALPYLDLLGSYTTYGGGTPERITNLELAVAGINGVEIQPGGVFSYNEALGPRTAERGYQVATVIVNGEHEKGIGGGICQITTTLFVASLYADLDILERHNHSGRVDYVDDGLDAAVVYGGQDFRFQNNTGYPIKITASYYNGAVNVKIYGTKTNENTVKLSTEQIDENSCKTFRSIYDESGGLLETQQICTSTYKK